MCSSLFVGYIFLWDYIRCGLPPEGNHLYKPVLTWGGEVDIYFRIVQPHLEKALGVRIIPEYKPAAGGAVAWSFLAAAKPDGYTIGGFSLPHVILQPWFIKDTKFTPDDFTYLNMLAYTPIGLAVKMVSG